MAERWAVVMGELTTLDCISVYLAIDSMVKIAKKI
jgi:hypothetical protein